MDYSEDSKHAQHPKDEQDRQVEHVCRHEVRDQRRDGQKDKDTIQSVPAGCPISLDSELPVFDRHLNDKEDGTQGIDEIDRVGLNTTLL